MKKSIFLSLVFILIFGGFANSLRVFATDVGGALQGDPGNCTHEQKSYEALGLTHSVKCIECQEELGEEAHVDENSDMCCDLCGIELSTLAPSEGEGYVESELTLNEGIKISIKADEEESEEIKEVRVNYRNIEIDVNNDVYVPSDFEATIAENSDKITVTWTSSEDTTLKYELYAKKENEDWTLLGYDVTSPYEHSKLESNSIYEYRIRAYNDNKEYGAYAYTNGSTSGVNTFSVEAVLDTVKPVIVPVSIEAAQAYVKSGDSIVITFEVTDENYYKLYNTLTAEDLIIKVGTITIDVPDMSITKSDVVNGENIMITISELPYTSLRGALSIVIPNNKLLDKALNGNLTTEINTGLTVVNSNITNTAPTLETNANTVTVICNQTTDFEPDDVTIYYEYRKSGDTEFIRDTSNVLVDLEGQTEYEVRTILEDITGNAVISESAFITTGKALTAIDLKVVSPATGTYVFGTEVVIEGTLAEGVTLIDVPNLTVKFGAGKNIELIGEYDSASRVITYKYTIKFEDLGLLTSVKYEGSIIDADAETIEYNSKVPLGGNSITARTGVKLIENGVETYYPYLVDAINAANTDGNISNILMQQSEEISDAIHVLDSKNFILDLNGKDVIFVEPDSYGLFNYGNITIKDDIGTSEITASGDTYAKTIQNDGTLTIVSGQIKATLNEPTGEAVAIENTGTVIIGIDDGDISTDIPVIDSAEFGVINSENGTVYFYDGVIIGSRDKSYEGQISLPEGYDLVTERIANNREKTYIGVDKIPPTLTHTILTRGWRNDYIEVQIYAYDEESGIKFVKIDNEEIELNGTTTIRLTENKEYIAYAEDNAGNSTTKSIIIETLDKVAPVISTVTMEEELSNDNTEVIVEVQDTASGLAGIIIKTVDEIPTNAENWIEFNMYPTSKQFVSVTLTKNSTYYCFAKDRAGNISRYNDEIQVTNIDKVKPTIQRVDIIEDEDKDYVSGKAVVVDVVATDNIGVTEILVSNELLTDEEVRESSDWKGYNQHIVHELPIDVDGVYTVYVWVKDGTGNISMYASTSVELKTLVVGDNMYDYTGSDVLYNMSSLRFRTEDHNYDFDSAVEEGELVLRLTLGDQVIRNITTGLTINKLSNYTDDDYEGEVYELEMRNLPGTGALNLVLLKNSLVDLARNHSDAIVCATDMFVDNNPPTISVVNTGATDAESVEIRDITVSDAEGYLIELIEITTDGLTKTYALNNGRASIPVKDGAVIVAYDKAGNEKSHTVGKTVEPTLTIDAEVELEYGGPDQILTYTYNGDGVVTVVSSDTNIANVSINPTTKQITISPVNAGNCEITLRTTETENYSESKKTILVTVKPKAVELTWTTSTFDYDGTRKFVYATVENAVANDVVEPYRYTNNNKINAGEYRAEVVELNNDNYTVIGGTNVTLDWKINKINRTLTLASTLGEVERSGLKNIQFTYTGQKADAIVTSADESIAKAKVNNYDGNGEVVIEGMEYGNTTITVSIPESTNYNEATATYDVSVFVYVRIYFNTDGGATINSQLVRYNEPYGTLPTVAKTGYEFDGWYTEDTFVNEVIDTTIVTNAESHTLYAKMTASIYTITLDANGGNVTPNTIEVAYQGTYNGLPTPTRTGYTFNGWYMSASGGTRVTNTTTVTATADHMLYARWEAKNKAPSSVSISVSGKTTSSITFSISGTDPDGDELTYDIYIDDTIDGSTTSATYTASNLNQYTLYTYYVIAKDPSGLSKESSSDSVRTYCPGYIGHALSDLCNDYVSEWVKCTGCDGSGYGNCTGNLSVRYEYEDYQRCSTCDGRTYYVIYECTTCSRVPGVESCSTCGYSIITDGIDMHYCLSCSGTGGESKVTQNCPHGYGKSHYYCETHNTTSWHTINCSHDRSEQHDD